MTLFRGLAKKLTDNDNNNSVSTKLRRQRIAPLLKIIEELYINKGSVTIADIGGTEKYWQIAPNGFLNENKIEITIVNLPGSLVPNNNGPFKFVEADACDLSCFENNSFDIAHSNSVLEHVGDWSRMKLFASEIRRISPLHFVQTPNFWFPIEPHCMTPFFHWLPQPIKIWLLMNYQLGHWSKADSVDQAVQDLESARLLNKKMLKELFKDSRIVTEWFCLFPKSFTAINKDSLY
jgi:hypothetical protein